MCYLENGELQYVTWSNAELYLSAAYCADNVDTATLKQS